MITGILNIFAKPHATPHSQSLSMKNLILSLACFVISVLSVTAQKLITVQSTNDVFQYESIDSALANAIDGDQIFIPGGSYTVGDLHLNKSLLIFGAGHYPDSTTATGQTLFNGNVILSNGSSAGLITGLSINGDIKVDTTGMDSVSNFTITRCTFKNLMLSSNGLPPTNARNFSIHENVIRGNIMGANTIGVNCSKNIVEGFLGYLQTAVILNNDFIGTGNCIDLPHAIIWVVNSSIDNNIFLYSTPGSCPTALFFDTNSVNNVMMNNLFTMNLNFPVGGNSGLNNIVSQPVNTIFTSAAGTTFSYGDNYHLNPGSPGIYGGTDTHDIGIYGTADPFKEGSAPFNPHIRQKSVSTMTNPQGLLNVHIKVAAQER
jgi:hypothetical protein